MRVIVAFDGSVAATNAVALVEAIAWPTDSILRVVNVVEPIPLPLPGPLYRGAGMAPEVEEAITAYAQPDRARRDIQRSGRRSFVAGDCSPARPCAVDDQP